MATNRILPFVGATRAPQPIPRVTKVLYGPGEVTIIARSWDEDPRGACRLCPVAECSVEDRLCMIRYHKFVPLEAAALHRG